MKQDNLQFQIKINDTIELCALSVRMGGLLFYQAHTFSSPYFCLLEKSSLPLKRIFL